MKKSAEIIRMIVVSLLIAFAALVVVYTLWFIYMQIFNLPVGYYQHYDGKGAARCVSNFYCMSFWGVKCCDLIAVVHQYLSISLVAFIYLYQIIFIPIVALTFFPVFIISFIIQYVRRRNRGR